MTTSRWDQREQCLLEALAAAGERGEWPSSEALAEATGLGRNEAGLALRRLLDGNYITAKTAGTYGGVRQWLVAVPRRP